MHRCRMWSNGFLQTLEIIPGRLRSHASGLWFVASGPGELAEARLIRGWVLGAVAGLALRRADGRPYQVLVLRWRQDPETWRRLLVRLWYPAR
jgi:hypothetical protein